QLSLSGTDLEVEMSSKTIIEDAESGEITVPARKIYEIVRALPDASQLRVYQSDEKITLQAGRSKFTLLTVPAERKST
ncbi:DNA polymerase III subunit beta, partial [Xylella fastidiosa subsp. multiplex]|nr:DNA polymerase III subunit beta [Xylella fastidiosa subsp. multiplex]